MQRSPRQKQTLRTGLAVIIVSLAVFGLGYYIHHSIGQLKEALPQTVLAHRQAVSGILNDLNSLAHAAEIAQLDPGGKASARLKHYLDRAIVRLHWVQNHTDLNAFENTATVLAIFDYALRDVQRWATEGSDRHAADSAVVNQIIYLRVHDAFAQIRRLAGETNLLARAALDGQAERLERFQRSATWLLLLLAVMTVAVVALFVIQRNSAVRLQRSQQRMAESIASLDEGFALFDRQHRLIACNQPYRAIFKLDGERQRAGNRTAPQINPLNKPSELG